MYRELYLYELDYHNDISEEEYKYLDELRKPYLDDFNSRFGMSDEELEELFDIFGYNTPLYDILGTGDQIPVWVWICVGIGILAVNDEGALDVAGSYGLGGLRAFDQHRLAGYERHACEGSYCEIY